MTACTDPAEADNGLAGEGQKDMTGEIVRLDRVAKRYGENVTALHEVDLIVRRGEMVAVVGPSGSGKSTLLNLIGTLDLPSSGTIRIDGLDVAALSDRQLSALRATRIGFVFQQFHLAGGVPAVDNVADGLLYTGATQRERRRRAVDALHRVGLGHRLRHRPHELSGGEQQRVAIARATVGEPALLLADEPTGNLDTTSGEAVLGILDELNRSGTSIVLITHDLQIADRLPRQVRIRDGRVA